MFMKSKDAIINQFMKDRTGILCPNKTVRKIASNILVLLGWSGLHNSILAEVGPILNYKPVEMLDKLEVLLENEFDKI